MSVIEQAIYAVNDRVGSMYDNQSIGTVTEVFYESEVPTDDPSLGTITYTVEWDVFVTTADQVLQNYVEEGVAEEDLIDPLYCVDSTFFDGEIFPDFPQAA